MSLARFATVMVFIATVSGAMPVYARTAPQLGDEEMIQTYIYLLGRLLITRQQQLDFKEGFKWNELVHRKSGAVDWPNPNLDVAYSEAWVAVDETSCTIVTVPKIDDRYYTVQLLNGWGASQYQRAGFSEQEIGRFCNLLAWRQSGCSHGCATD